MFNGIEETECTALIHWIALQWGVIASGSALNLRGGGCIVSCYFMLNCGGYGCDKGVTA